MSQKNGAAPLPLLPRTVKLLGGTSFLNDVSSEMIFPLLPVFLVTVLGASPLALGFIEGISDTTSSLLKLVSGYCSDRFQRRRILVLAGYGLSTLLRPLIGIAGAVSTVFCLRLGDRIGKGIRTAPRDALIADSVGNAMAGRAFGFHRMMDHAGAVVGALIAASALWFFPGAYRPLFLWAAVPGLLAFCLLCFVHEAPHPGDRKTLFPTTPLPRRVKQFLYLLFFFSLGNASDAFLLLRLRVSGIPIPALPLLWALLHLVKAPANAWLGRLSDRGHRGIFLLIGWLLYSAIYTLFAFPLARAVLIAVFLGYGIFYGFTEPVEKALLKEWVGAERLGSVYGLYHTVLGLALLPASLLFGLLWKTWGYQTAFGFGAAITLVTAIIWTGFSLRAHALRK